VIRSEKLTTSAIHTATCLPLGEQPTKRRQKHCSANMIGIVCSTIYCRGINNLNVLISTVMGRWNLSNRTCYRSYISGSCDSNSSHSPELVPRRMLPLLHSDGAHHLIKKLRAECSQTPTTKMLSMEQESIMAFWLGHDALPTSWAYSTVFHALRKRDEQTAVPDRIAGGARIYCLWYWCQLQGQLG
jgi:hypothetical protein